MTLFSLALLIFLFWLLAQTLTVVEASKENLEKHLDRVISFLEDLDNVWKPLPAHTYESHSYPTSHSRYLFFQSAYMQREAWKEMEKTWATILGVMPESLEGLVASNDRLLRIMIIQDESMDSFHSQSLSTQLKQLLGPVLSSLEIHLQITIREVLDTDISPVPHILVVCTSPSKYLLVTHQKMQSLMSESGVLVLSYSHDYPCFENQFHPFPSGGADGGSGSHLYGAPTDILTCVLNKPMAFRTWGEVAATIALRDFFSYTQVFEHCVHPAYLESHLQRDGKLSDSLGHSYIAQQLGYVWMQMLASILDRKILSNRHLLESYDF